MAIDMDERAEQDIDERKKLVQMKQVCDDIAWDMKADADNFDGKPFNGRTVAEYFGSQGAAIAALARVVEMLIDERRRDRGEPSSR